MFTPIRCCNYINTPARSQDETETMYRAYNSTPPPSPGVGSDGPSRPTKLVDYTKHRRDMTDTMGKRRRRGLTHHIPDENPTPPARQPARGRTRNKAMPAFRGVDEKLGNSPHTTERIEFLFKIQSPHRRNSSSFQSRRSSLESTSTLKQVNRSRKDRSRSRGRRKQRGLVAEIEAHLKADSNFLQLAVE